MIFTQVLAPSIDTSENSLLLKKNTINNANMNTNMNTNGKIQVINNLNLKTQTFGSSGNLKKENSSKNFETDELVKYNS